MTASTPGASAMAGILSRMWRASLLKAEVYEEVEADRGATVQAFAVVVLSSVAAGIGSIENGGISGVFWSTVSSLVGWYIWAYATYMIGSRLLPTAETVADHGELLRTIGFSSSPGVLRVFGFITPITGAVYAISSLWMLVAMVVAVRQALDYESTGRAIAVCAIGFPLYLVIFAVSLLVLGPWPV